ncbi:IS66 family insertion sequence element accessory protein TnpA [Myxococcus qinghaiensis]|uniref:IS66 family insertion sequence element accessory protein TnpA n=1 Tax=Myxococcus qinghaiensis TaxID=2906758 RepID=UPI0020A7EB19|nr:IS66 family insertion sequence element accessory protein TnpB [Myxococcus qinghaiensis]MCP3170235.1 IS66 family insertion sequence element accessory protein TnpB [Myxococcus qinghaiensis]
MQKRAEKPEWVRVAEEFEASGLTQREFAGRRGLRLSTVQSWVYRRRRQVSTEAAPPVRLLPVQVSSVPAFEAVTLEVVSATGVRVRFAPGTDVGYVARLVAALERAAC